MIYIDFMGGLHGNFLAYVINSLDDNFDRSILPFTKFGTSHNSYEKKLAQANHYSCWNLIIPNNTNVLSISADIDDCLLLNLLCFGRSGDYNFDLKNFHINFYKQIKDTKFFDLANNIQMYYNYDVIKHNHVPRGILREYFKFGFKDYKINGILKVAQDLKYINCGLNFNFKKLYSFDSFIELINEIVRHYQLAVIVDKEWLLFLWNNFIANIKEIKLTNHCYDILKAVKNNQNLELDLNLLQESWINAQLENLYKIEMPFHQEQYFTNTIEISNFIKEST